MSNNYPTYNRKMTVFNLPPEEKKADKVKENLSTLLGGMEVKKFKITRGVSFQIEYQGKDVS